MLGHLRALLSISFVIAVSGCTSGPPKPVLPEGLHRVPINRVSLDSSAAASSARPDAVIGGGR
ncbi:hypothetical protein C9I57_30775 [Trinickia symbiotica]|uniref:Uncharacterized protein n=1 Tax=Trinickia symbiotica TaxID=863227 RepID=A0A2T3XK94_9BURK|nr:hypothetical protein C9I57_30775 [Trinickia symbiotica]